MLIPKASKLKPMLTLKKTPNDKTVFFEKKEISVQLINYR